MISERRCCPSKAPEKAFCPFATSLRFVVCHRSSSVPLPFVLTVNSVPSGTEFHSDFRNIFSQLPGGRNADLLHRGPPSSTSGNASLTISIPSPIQLPDPSLTPSHAPSNFLLGTNGSGVSGRCVLMISAFAKFASSATTVMPDIIR
jgi:hypothetical protein